MYSIRVTVPIRWKLTLWICIALLGSAPLTWREWVEHHPPEIAILAVIHFVFVFVAVVLLTYLAQWFLRGIRRGKSDLR